VRAAADTFCPAASADGLNRTAQPAATAVAAPPPPPKRIAAREWQLIAKNPAAHTGERVIVYGKVTQFVAATGTSGFRANVDRVAYKPKYGFADCDTNTVLGGNDALLQEIVNGDLFKAEATMASSYSLRYDARRPADRAAPGGQSRPHFLPARRLCRRSAVMVRTTWTARRRPGQPIAALWSPFRTVIVSTDDR